MLTAYFDDSGTHDQSDIVVWAGFFGNQYQWQLFDELWAAKLKNPCPGKEEIRQFHMYDCEHGENEFSYWKRPEREYLANELIDIINKCMLSGFAVGASRKDWDELIAGDRRAFHGDAEAFCMKACYAYARNWGIIKASYDKEMSYVFDSRPHRNAQNQAVFDLYERDDDRRKKNLASQMLNQPEITSVSLTFSSSQKFRPLQAADLLAWEFYQNANDVLRGAPDTPQRDQLRRLLKSGRLMRAITTREQVKYIAEQDDIDYAELAKNLPPGWRL